MCGFTLERIFVNELVERCFFVSKFSPSTAIYFLQSYCRRFEVQNIMRILRSKVMMTPKGALEIRLFPIERYSSVNFKALLNSNSVDEAIELLAETVYSPSKEAIQLYESNDSLIPLEAFFERNYAEELIKSAETLPQDKDSVNSLIRTQFDIRNCITVIGGVIQGLDPYLLKSLVIPHYYKISATDIAKIINSNDALSITPTVFRPYIKVVNALLAGEESMTYLEGLRYIYKENESVRHTRPYSFAFILTYLISCEIEQRNLTRIAFGKEYNDSVEEIVAHLVIN
ncbi:MAG: hypothetical protein E4H21_11440 [Thermodesulfobacteriales bacterium]|nr:MAG: hypothetical protein E4H21_11440 [Thermodesulfobacteriales bacterium]